MSKRSANKAGMDDIDDLVKSKLKRRKLNNNKKKNPVQTEDWRIVLNDQAMIKSRRPNKNNESEKNKDRVLNLIFSNKKGIHRTPAFRVIGKLGGGGYLGKNPGTGELKPEKSSNLLYINLDDELHPEHEGKKWAEGFEENLLEYAECLERLLEKCYDAMLYDPEVQPVSKKTLLLEIPDRECKNLKDKLSDGRPDLKKVPKCDLEKIRNKFIGQMYISVFRRVDSENKKIEPLDLYERYGDEIEGLNMYYDNFKRIPGTIRQLIVKNNSYKDVGHDRIIEKMPPSYQEEAKTCKTKHEKENFIKEFYTKTEAIDFSSIESDLSKLDDNIKLRNIYNAVHGYELRPIKLFTALNGEWTQVDFERSNMTTEPVVKSGDIIKTFVMFSIYSNYSNEFKNFGIKAVLIPTVTFVDNAPVQTLDLGEVTDEAVYLPNRALYSNGKINGSNNESEEEEEEEMNIVENDEEENKVPGGKYGFRRPGSEEEINRIDNIEEEKSLPGGKYGSTYSQSDEEEEEEEM